MGCILCYLRSPLLLPDPTGDSEGVLSRPSGVEEAAAAAAGGGGGEWGARLAAGGDSLIRTFIEPHNFFN